MKAYIDSTLKSAWNVEFNLRLCDALEVRGVQCHLPQRDTDQRAAKESILAPNIAAIDECQLVVAVAQNESPNWGVEVGYAVGRGYRVVILAPVGHDIPLMARHRACIC